MAKVLVVIAEKMFRDEEFGAEGSRFGGAKAS